jgi:hypothetical protein
MVARVNGYNFENKTYATGTTGLLSIAVQAGVDFDVNGIVTPLDDFKRLYSIDPAGSQYIDATYGWYKDNSGTQNFQYVIPTANRTFSGVTATGASGTTATIGASTTPVAINAGTSAADAAYVKAYYAQLNVKRIVDTLQQRGVLLGTSKVQAISATAPISTTNGWNVNIAAGAGTYVITFIVEKIAAFDVTSANSYGQPGSTTVGLGLVNDLLNLTLLDATGNAVALTAANSAVNILGPVPQVF